METQETPTYDSFAQGNQAVFEFKELIRYRDLVGQLVSRNLTARYKRSVLGILWTMLNPLMMTVILAFVFSNLFAAKQQLVAYILVGLIAWNFFQQVSTHAMSELVWGGTLLQRIYIPKTIFAVSALGTGIVNLGLSLIPVFIVMVVIKTPFKLTLLFLPISIILLAGFSLGLGLFLSNLSSGFTDVFEMYQIFTTGWYFLTPILYPLDIISPQKLWLFKLNPMYALVEVFRQPIVNGVIPDRKILALAAFSSLFALVIGWWTFTRNAAKLAYRV
jgi:ABC-type polysaccharide/polyol phosphate export permease